MPNSDKCAKCFCEKWVGEDGARQATCIKGRDADECNGPFRSDREGARRHAEENTVQPE